MDVDNRIKEILAARDRLRFKIKDSAKLQATLETAKVTAKELNDKVCSTAELADKVSAKVRSLDIAKNRVQECQKRVADILALQACHSGVVAAMESEDYEQAAGHVHRFLAIDMSTIQGTAADQIGSAATERAVQQLLDAKAKLCKVVGLRFDEAVASEDAASVERYFKMFAMLNMDEGLSKFAHYLSKEIAANGKLALNRARTSQEKGKGSNTAYADALRDFLESTAKVIDMRQPLTETYYGPGYLLQFVEVLQKECDRYATEIVRAFKESRGLNYTYRLVSDQLRSSSSLLEKPDLKSLAPLLTEITFLSARAEIYYGFLRRRITADIEIGVQNSEAQKSLSGRLEAMLQNRGGLSNAIQEVISQYIVLEQYAMTEKLKRVIAMETRVEGSTTSSLVDDAFFVLHEGIMCAISSSNIDAVCAVINNAGRLIEEQIALSVTPDVAWPSGMMADISQAYSLLQQGKSDIERIKTQFLVSLNNAEMSIQYVDRLILSIKEEAKLTPSFVGASAVKQRTKLDSCLSLLESSKEELRRVLLKSRQQLKEGAIKSKLKPVIDDIQTVNHNLSEEEYALYESQDPWAADVLSEIDSLLSTFRPELSDVNMEAFVEDAASETAILLEKTIGKLDFNRLGGLLLECEVRKIIAYFSALSGWNVRDRFSRVVQIAAVLTVEKVGEVVEVAGSGTRGQRGLELTSNEIRNILGLRVEFSREEVRRLKL